MKNLLDFVKENLPKTSMWKRHGSLFDEERFASLEEWELHELEKYINQELGLYFSNKSKPSEQTCNNSSETAA